MSINEIPRKRVAAPAPTESIFSNALGAPKKRVRKAENITEDFLRKRLETLWATPIPPGPAGNDVYKKRQRGIAATEKRLREMGVSDE